MVESKQTSFWEKDFFLRPYDLIVIGAGIVGLSSALFYKRANPAARVLVLDKGFIPEGASTRNAGFACVGSVGELLGDLEYDTEQNIKARLLKRCEGLQLLRETLGDEAIDYENCGGYELFTSEKKFEEVASRIDHFNRILNELSYGKDVYQPARFEGYPVIYNRLEGSLHPGKMMRALVKKATAAGVEIRWNTPVIRLKDDRVKVEGNLEPEAAQILVAANGFTVKLLPELPVKPARGFVMVSDEWKDMPWKGIFHHNRGYIYFRNAGNRLLIGGARHIAKDEEETNQFGINLMIKNHLLQFAKEVLKLPKKCKIEYEWSVLWASPKRKRL